jgi:hypothetical protein
MTLKEYFICLVIGLVAGIVIDKYFVKLLYKLLGHRICFHNYFVVYFTAFAIGIVGVYLSYKILGFNGANKYLCAAIVGFFSGLPFQFYRPK